MVKDNVDDQPLNEGDEVFIIGYPQGFYQDRKNWPVVRQAVVAQIQPYLRGSASTFLIDGSVFGGNSGGPVVTKPQMMSIAGTQQLDMNALVGMVSGHVTSGSAAENADLGIVVPPDKINETVNMVLDEIAILGRPKWRFG